MSPSTTVFEPSEGQMEAKTEMDSSQTQERIPKGEIVSNVKNFKMIFGIYTGDMKNGKRHGQGVFVFSNMYSIGKNKMYSGSWIDDVQEGQGTLTDIVGNTFFGTFKNNVLEGFATKKIRSFFDDCLYFHWLINRFDGEFDKYRNPRKGVATFVNGWTFHCDYNEKGKPHGKGCVKDCAHNVVFENEWKNGYCANSLFDISSVLSSVCFVGLCVMALIIIACFFNFGYQLFDEKFGSGFKHTGQMWQFKPHGFGSRVINHQGVYNGSWENGLRHGHGVMKWDAPQSSNQGDVYDGEWHKGQRHGLGVATLSGKGVYNGSWENDMRHGKGTMIFDDPKATNRGDVCVGQWANDTLSYGGCAYRNGVLYVGNFVDNMYHGYGVLNYTDGSSYAGEFSKNWREGHGVLHFANGDRYVGNWKGDMREGHGVLYSTGINGYEVWKGEWVRDKQYGWFSHTRKLFRDIPLFLISFDGVMRDYQINSGTKVVALIPNVVSATLVYKDAKVVSAIVTLFSVVTIQVFYEVVAAIISIIVAVFGIMGSFVLVGTLFVHLIKK